MFKINRGSVRKVPYFGIAWIRSTSKPFPKSRKVIENEKLTENTSIPTDPSSTPSIHLPNNPVSGTIPSVDWNWIPPRASTLETKSDDDLAFPVLDGVLFTVDEVIPVLNQLGGSDIVVLDVTGKLDTLENFILVTGRSPRHLRKMSSTLVQALKARKLTKAPGWTGPEGDKDDDWQIVDCYNFAVHFLLEGKRKTIDLESHWRAADRPTAKYFLREEDYENYFSELLEKYPVPMDSQDLEDQAAAAAAAAAAARAAEERERRRGRGRRETTPAQNDSSMLRFKDLPIKTRSE